MSDTPTLGGWAGVVGPGEDAGGPAVSAYFLWLCCESECHFCGDL